MDRNIHGSKWPSGQGTRRRDLPAHLNETSRLGCRRGDQISADFAALHESVSGTSRLGTRTTPPWLRSLRRGGDPAGDTSKFKLHCASPGAEVHRPVLARPLSLICRYPFIWEFRFLVALSPRAGLVTLRQTFVRRRHGGGNRPCWGLEDEHSELTVNGAQLEYVGGGPATGSNYLMIDK